MAWIVTSWRSEALEAARRERADAHAYLEALERFGTDTRAEVRRQRVALRADGGGETVSMRRTRASLRDSPLAELFRATADG